MQNKKVFLQSLGCPKNLVDAEMMLGQLMRDGYSVTDQAEEAETIIVNTCSFIDEAREESVQAIMAMASLKESAQVKKLVVSGCLAQRYKDELSENLPEADVIVGSGEFQNISKILKNETTEQQRHYHKPTFLQQEETPRVNSGPFFRAYLKISEGCKKRCAFCAIPKIRGNLQSREIASIVAEARLLVASGVKEIIVISHDFTDYGWDLRRKDNTSTESPFELLKALSDVEGLDWIRVLYMYPDGINKELIELMKSRKNLIPYFDIPLQHINDNVLKSMNRRMTRKEIEKSLSLVRKEIPDAVIRTQFIVGFPGETAEQFDELLEFVKEQNFDRVGCFKYSPEEGTAGITLEQDVAEEVKQLRHDRLMSVQKEISNEMHKRFIGKVLPVVIEGFSEETELLLQGRTQGQAPEIDGVVLINEGQAKVGDIVSVEIMESHDYDLVGRIVGEKSF